MSVLLTKTQTVMRLKPLLNDVGADAFGIVFFESPYDEEAGETWRRDVSMLADEWEEMGKPNTITVTIEVGDTLNEEGTDQ